MITKHGYKTLFWIIGGIATLSFLYKPDDDLATSEGNAAITYGGTGGGCGCGG